MKIEQTTIVTIEPIQCARRLFKLPPGYHLELHCWLCRVLFEREEEVGLVLFQKQKNELVCENCATKIIRRLVEENDDDIKKVSDIYPEKSSWDLR